MKTKIGVFGLWHLGCTISVSWSNLGYPVVGFENDKKIIDALNNGEPPIFEPFLKENMLTNIENGLLSFTSDQDDLSDCDFVFVTYDTPVDEDDISDTTIVENSIKQLSGIMKDQAVIIVSSQSPVGFISQMRILLKDKNETLEIAYSPENLRLGEAIDCYLNPGRIILGTSTKATEEKCVELFKNITDDILCMSIESSEMVKHGINSFLATSIVFTNHLADICEENNASIDDVVRGLKSDPRIGMKAYLSPGIGFSGGTLGRDLKVLAIKNQLANGYGKLFGFIHKSNNERKLSIVDKVKKIVNPIKGITIGVLGLTYKPGTSTLRRSLPMEIVNILIEEGAVIKVYDPKANYAEINSEINFQIVDNVIEASKNADILILLTEWDEFKKYDWSGIAPQMKNPNFFDTKNCLNKENMYQNGFKYYSIGRNNS
ncbi:MAG: nucleotide sugar dehydrogenase [Mucilaginibacter sp.]